MYRLMVRSDSSYDFYNGGWQRRYVWSTWTRSDDLLDLLAQADSIAAGQRDGAATVRIIPEEQYVPFCATHRIA